jgi:multiple sugar transport system permease protein
LYVLGATMLVPFYWMVLGAFKPVPELTRDPPSFVVEHPSTANFSDPDAGRPGHVAGLFQRFTDVPLGFWRFFLNSIGIATAITVGSLLIASLAAYVITKSRLPGRRAIFLGVIATMMVPWQVSLIPNFLIVRNLGWLDSYLGYVVPALPKAFVVFFLVQYLRSIPDDLLAAARVDGAGEWRIWWQIVMPLLRPALAAMAIFVALGEWNNFVWPVIIVQSDSMANLPVALNRLNAANAQDPRLMGVMMAGALITCVPTLVFLLTFQKHFTRGIALSGIKG